jgi:prevent-host-death family protein
MMTTVSIRDAKNRLTELARQVEGGETIVVTRHGKPVFDLVPHKPRAGLNFGAIAEFKRRRSVSAVATYVAQYFDAPLPEDFLLNPLPSET